MIAATWADQIKSDSAYRDDGTAGGNRPGGSEARRNTGYADTLRHKYWHFVDTPFTAITGGHLPPVPVPNAQDRIVLFLSVLSSPSPDPLKSYDLTWLLHLIGDVHQPLHAATRVTAGHGDGDNGGNTVKICDGGGCSSTTSLHSVWDGLLGPQGDVASAMSAARSLPPATTARAAVLDPAQWIDESLALAKSEVYQTPVRDGIGPYALTAPYRTRAKQLAGLQISLAGSRLAAVLNRSLASTVRSTN